MLPSSGYFKSFTCPFFKSGFCERPHCHFRHVDEPAATTFRELPSSTDEILPDTTKPSVAAPSAPAATPAPATAAPLPLDSTLLQEMVSRAVREALQGGTSAGLNPDAIAASLGAAPGALAAAAAPETELEPPPTAKKHRVYPIPASVSYKPTPLRDLERRRSVAEPRFSDDDNSDDEKSSAPTSSASSSDVRPGPGKDSGAGAAAEPQAGAASAAKQAEEFDLLEQIMAESSKPIQMTTTLKRRLRARPVVFQASARGDEPYEPPGTEDAHAAPAYQPTKKPGSAGDGAEVAAAGGLDVKSAPGAAVEGNAGGAQRRLGVMTSDADTPGRVEENTPTPGVGVSEPRGAVASIVSVTQDSKMTGSTLLPGARLSSENGVDGAKKSDADITGSEYSSRNGYGGVIVKQEPPDVKAGCDSNSKASADRDGRRDSDTSAPSAASGPVDDGQSSRKRSRASSDDDSGASKRRHSEAEKASGGSADRDRSKHDHKHRDKSSRDRDKHVSSRDRDKPRSSSSRGRDGRDSSLHRDKARSSRDGERDKSRSSKGKDESSGHSNKSESSRGDVKADRKSSHSGRDKSHPSHDRDGKSSHSSSSHSSKDRSKDRDRKSDHRSSSHSHRDKSSSKDRDRSSSSKTRGEKSKSSRDAHKSSSSKDASKRRSPSKDAARSSDSSSKARDLPGGGGGGSSLKRSRSSDEPRSKTSRSDSSGAEAGPSEPGRPAASADGEPAGGRSGSGSPLPDLSALEELPDDWEYPDGLLQPSDLESESDAEDTLAECERMFNEYRPPTDGPQLTAALNKARALQEKANKEAGRSSVEVLGKKRRAHTAGPDQPQRPVARAVPKVTPAQAMHARWQKLAEMQQQRIEQLEQQQKKREAENSGLPPLLPQPPVPKRRRVAHVPNVGALLQKPAAAAAPVASSATPATAAAKTVTPAQTAPRGGKRLAHTPSSASVARPKIPADLGGKVPTAIRQRYLDHFCTELLKIYPGDEAQAYKKALEEEQVVYNRSPSRRVYVNLSVGAVKRLRDAAALKSSQNGTWVLMPRRQPLADLTNVGGWPFGVPAAAMMHPHHYMNSVFSFVPHEFYYSQLPSPGYGGVAVANRTVSHLDVLAGRGGATGSWSIERTKKADETWTDAELYARMLKYVLTDEQLDKNGFPRPDPLGRAGRAHLAHVDARSRITRVGATYRECTRCARTYEVSAEGKQVVPNSCSYHWARPYTFRGLSKYRCCMQVSPAEPCSYADCHVSDNFDPDNLIGYMATMDKPDPEDGNHGVFALDCEMSYTTQGCELTRVTVVNAAGDTVYETIVKPDNPIIDYNTRFSGIKESDMEGVTVSIRDVQAVLLNMFSSKTILIGHSLESDFKALKLIHATVADTSVVFPHKNGPPYKRGLKMLCQDYLKRFIQDDVGGHDSAEDAISAMDLMIWRLREDAKLMR